MSGTAESRTAGRLPSRPSLSTCSGLVERVAAGAGSARVRVVDREALLLDGVHEVDGRAHQVRRAHLVGDHVHAGELSVDVPVHLTLVEVQLVTQPGTAARLDGDAQPQVIAAFLLQE